MHLDGFIIEKFVTMHGHMNVKLAWIFPSDTSRFGGVGMADP